MKLAENREDWAWVVRNMGKIRLFRGLNPGGAMGGKRIPYKNRRVMWKDGKRNENRRRCEE